MRIVSWNVNARVGSSARRQIQALLALEPDVLALQEVSAKSCAIWSESLIDAGYGILLTVAQLSRTYPPGPYPSPPFPPGKRGPQIQLTKANLTASRRPISLLDGLSFDGAAFPEHAFPEKYLAAGVVIDGIEVRIHNAHLPPGVSRGLLKMEAFQAIRRRVDTDGDVPLVLCGDFNAPVEETAEAPVYRDEPAWHGQAGRWRDAEASVVHNPRLRDVYRDVHRRSEPMPASLYVGTKRRAARRYDHVFASRHFRTTACTYLEDWLKQRLSDHAPVVADLELCG